MNNKSPKRTGKLSPVPSRMSLRLYVAGRAPNSLLAIANMKAILRDHRVDAHELEIVDVLEQPERTLRDGILVTPMLLKLSPEPKVRVIGDLSETAKVMLALGIEGVRP